MIFHTEKMIQTDRRYFHLRLVKLTALLVGTAALVLFFVKAPALERVLVERLLNSASQDLFHGSLQIQKAGLDRRLRIHLEGLSGNLRSRGGEVPLLVQTVRSRDSLLGLLIQKPVRFDFAGVKPSRSLNAGLRGEAVLQTGKQGRFELKASIERMDLGDLEWMDPRNLKGASGRLTGDLVLRTDSSGRSDFELKAKVEAPGGRIPSHLFDLLLPYLPERSVIDQVRALQTRQKIVGYKEAALHMNLAASDQMKVFLHILIPEYTMDLNLNMEIRLDEKNAFGQLSQILGLIEVET